MGSRWVHLFGRPLAKNGILERVCCLNLGRLFVVKNLFFLRKMDRPNMHVFQSMVTEDCGSCSKKVVYCKNASNFSKMVTLKLTMCFPTICGTFKKWAPGPINGLLESENGLQRHFGGYGIPIWRKQM